VDPLLSAPGLAKLAYEAYGNVTGHRNHQGDPMPGWEELPPRIQLAWDAAAVTAAQAGAAQ
jgi:hypothetical protein